jgi:hypothetical protein
MSSLLQQSVQKLPSGPEICPQPAQRFGRAKLTGAINMERIPTIGPCPQFRWASQGPNVRRNFLPKTQTVEPKARVPIAA